MGESTIVLCRGRRGLDGLVWVGRTCSCGEGLVYSRLAMELVVFENPSVSHGGVDDGRVWRGN